MGEGGNFDIAFKAERKRVVRCFQSYTGEQRANHAASHRLGHRQRVSEGEFFYTHPDIPLRAFSTRKQAALAALDAPVTARATTMDKEQGRG